MQQKHGCMTVLVLILNIAFCVRQKERCSVRESFYIHLPQLITFLSIYYLEDLFYALFLENQKFMLVQFINQNSFIYICVFESLTSTLNLYDSWSYRLEGTVGIYLVPSGLENLQNQR